MEQKNTILHRSIKNKRIKNRSCWRQIRDLISNGESSKNAEKIQKLINSESFLFWAPFDSQDMLYGRYLGIFLEMHDLIHWPHRKEPQS